MVNQTQGKSDLGTLWSRSKPRVRRLLSNFLEAIRQQVANIRQGISRLIASAAGSLLLAFFSVGSAAFVSVCSSLIFGQVASLITGIPSDTYIHLITAITLSLIALLLVWLRERGLLDITRRRELDLKLQSEEMEKRLTNLPPRQFIDEYIEVQKRTGGLHRASKQEAAQGTLDIDNLTYRIRTIMSSILSLTRLWDGVSASNRSVIYHANIMRVLMRDEIELSPNPELDFTGGQPNTQGGSLKEWLLQFEFFLHKQSYEVAISRCSGILFLQDNVLSVTSKTYDEPDGGIEEICLPFTMREDMKIGFHHPNIPGAPSVAASGDAEYITGLRAHTSKWLDDLKIDESEVSRRYENQLRDYYSRLEHVKSLISIPIKYEDKFLGVLNISKNNDNMLMNAERAGMFTLLLEPICYHLGRMIYLLEALESNPNGVKEGEHEQ